MDDLKKKAIEAKTALEEAKVATEKSEEEKQQLQTDFDNSMIAWKAEIDKLEQKTDRTDDETSQLKVNKTEYRNIQDLLSTEKKETYALVAETQQATDALKDAIGEDAITTLEAYKDKPRSEITVAQDFGGYINARQTIIIMLGASKDLDQSSADILGPRTRAGVKTIQNYLNSLGVSRADLGCKNGIPDGAPGPKTLTALLEMDGEKTRLEKMFADKKTNALALTIVEPVYSTGNTSSTTNGNGNTPARVTGDTGTGNGEAEANPSDPKAVKDKYGNIIKTVKIEDILNVNKGKDGIHNRADNHVEDVIYGNVGLRFYGNGRVSVGSEGILYDSKTILDKISQSVILVSEHLKNSKYNINDLFTADEIKKDPKIIDFDKSMSRKLATGTTIDFQDVTIGKDKRIYFKFNGRGKQHSLNRYYISSLDCFDPHTLAFDEGLLKKNIRNAILKQIKKTETNNQKDGEAEEKKKEEKNNNKEYPDKVKDITELKKHLSAIGSTIGININLWNNNEYDVDDVAKYLNNLNDAVKKIDHQTLANLKKIGSITLHNQDFGSDFEDEGLSKTLEGKSVIEIDYDESPEDIIKDIKSGIKEALEKKLIS